MWLLDQQPPLETCWKCKVRGSTPDLQHQKHWSGGGVWGYSQNLWNLPGDSDAPWSLRTTVLKDPPSRLCCIKLFWQLRSPQWDAVAWETPAGGTNRTWDYLLSISFWRFTRWIFLPPVIREGAPVTFVLKALFRWLQQGAAIISPWSTQTSTVYVQIIIVLLGFLCKDLIFLEQF